MARTLRGDWRLDGVSSPSVSSTLAEVTASHKGCLWPIVQRTTECRRHPLPPFWAMAWLLCSKARQQQDAPRAPVWTSKPCCWLWPDRLAACGALVEMGGVLFFLQGVGELFLLCNVREHFICEWSLSLDRWNTVGGIQVDQDRWNAVSIAKDSLYVLEEYLMLSIPQTTPYRLYGNKIPSVLNVPCMSCA